MDNRPIGIFDSGVGGLTAVRELMDRLPGEELVYLGDTGRVPYGSRGRETIIKYALGNISFLLGHGVKMIVAACGTVSSTLPAEVIAQLPCPYVGVVEPVSAAAVHISPSGHIGVIGTQATIRSGSYPRAIRALRPEARVEAAACPLFVPLAENGVIGRDNAITRLTAEMYLGGMAQSGIDTLILGCTHYPLLRDVIGDVMGPGVALVDAGAQTAAQVERLLREKGLLADPGRRGGCRYYVTDAPEGFIQTAELFMGRPVAGAVSYVDVQEL